MAIYMGNLILVSAAGYFAHRTSRVVDGRRKYNWIYIFISMVSLSLVSGFRYRVGTDFGNYSEQFIYLAGNFNLSGGEPGFNLIRDIIRNVTDNPQLFFMITSIFINVGFVIFMVKNSDNLFLSFYFYITTMTYYLSMNGIKQYMASVIIVLGYEHILEGNFKKYLIHILIALMFHSSAFIMIPVYFLVRRKSDSIVNVALVFGTIFAVLFYNTFIEILFEFLKYTNFYYYKEYLLFEANSASPLRIIVWIASVMLMVMYKDRMRRVFGEKVDIVINLCFLGTICMVLATRHAFFVRVAMYFDIYYTLLLPKLCSAFDDNTNKAVTFLVMALYFSYSLFLLSIHEANVYPYNYNLKLF